MAPDFKEVYKAAGQVISTAECVSRVTAAFM